MSRRGVNALPIRLRLTLPFALVMALVLAAMGVFVYLRVGHELLRSTDQSLAAQLPASAKQAREQEPLLTHAVSEGPLIAQLELPDGSTRSSSPTSPSQLSFT